MESNDVTEAPCTQYEKKICCTARSSDYFYLYIFLLVLMLVCLLLYAVLDMYLHLCTQYVTNLFVCFRSTLTGI